MNLKYPYMVKSEQCESTILVPEIRQIIHNYGYVML